MSALQLLAHARRLSAEEIATLSKWVKQGSPQGNPADLPPMPLFTEGWQLGEPDAVVDPGEDFHVPAEGPDIYRCFVIPLQVPAGKCLRAAEFRPGNRKVVHHAVLTMLPSEDARRRTEAEPPEALRMLKAGRSARIAPNITRVMMSERTVATSDPEKTQYMITPAMAATAAIFLTGQSSLRALSRLAAP